MEEEFEEWAEFGIFFIPSPLRKYTGLAMLGVVFILWLVF